jgi:hypothetical protein
MPPTTHRAPAFGLGTLCTLLLVSGCEMPGGARPFGASPDEDVWAIRCITLRGPDRFQRAEGYATALKNVAGLKPALVQVASDEDETSVFYGRYRRIDAGLTESARYEPDPRRDLDTIRSLRFEARDVWPFMLATMDALPTYRSTHPEWDLNNVDGYWSLHVAVFYNTDTMHSRRFAAEEYCRILREQGEDAYFHHGPARSSVYIGAFPFEAVSEVQHEDALAGRMVKTVTIVDPKMKAAQERFPVSLENGHKMVNLTRDHASGEVTKRDTTPSFPVIMPKAQHRIDRAGGRS